MRNRRHKLRFLFAAKESAPTLIELLEQVPSEHDECTALVDKIRPQSSEDPGTTDSVG